MGNGTASSCSTSAVAARACPVRAKTSCICSRCGWNALWRRPTNGAGRHARRRPGIAGEASRRAHRCHHYWPIFTCAGLCWGGGSSALSKSLGTRLVNYADDLVILCRRGSAENALHHLREIMSKLKLTVNEEKTRVCRVPDGEF